MYGKVKDSEDVKKAQRESSGALDKAFDGLKTLMDERKQRLAQLRVTRRHQLRDLQERAEVPESVPRMPEPVPSMRSERPPQQIGQKPDMAK